MFKNLAKGLSKYSLLTVPAKRSFAVLNYQFVANLSEDQASVNTLPVHQHEFYIASRPN